MKQLFTFLLLITFSSFAQDFSLVDEKTRTYPKLLTAQELANKIDTDYNTDIEKVRSLYFWLTNNIRYDLEEYYNPTQTSYSFRYSTEEEKNQKLKAIDDKIVRETLSSRKAVCEGYARVFTKVCDLLNIENEFISGYARNSPQEIGKPLPNPNHAWNSVKLNGDWKYFDSTWGAGYEYNGKWQKSYNDYYFDIPKEKLFLSHFPDEKLWQLRVKRMSKKEFYNQPIYTQSFFKTKLELINPKVGEITKYTNGFAEIKLKSLLQNQRVFVGFNNSNVAKIPQISFKDKIASIKISPPVNASQLFLIVDGEVVLEFLIK